MYNLSHKEQLHVSALFIGHLQVDKWETLVSNYKQLYSTCVGCVQWGGQGWSGYPHHPWPPQCIQPTQVECSCLPMFLIYQPEDGQWKGPKHEVVLYVISYTYLYHHIVVLDRCTNSNLHGLQNHLIKYQSAEQHSIASRKNRDQFAPVRVLNFDIVKVHWMSWKISRSALSNCAFILHHEEAKCFEIKKSFRYALNCTEVTCKKRRNKTAVTCRPHVTTPEQCECHRILLEIETHQWPYHCKSKCNDTVHPRKGHDGPKGE